MIKVLLYGDLRRRAGQRVIELEYEGKTLLDLLKQISASFGLESLLFRRGKIRGELLILVNGADWNSLGYLDKIVDDGSLVKLVPVWHGG